MIVSLGYQEKVGPYEKLFLVLKRLNVKTKSFASYFDSAESKVILLMQLKKRYGKNHFYLGFSICNFIFGSKYWSNYRYDSSRAIYVELLNEITMIAAVKVEFAR
jgi:2-dehydropantoate 2-reductase